MTEQTSEEAKAELAVLLKEGERSLGILVSVANVYLDQYPNDRSWGFSKFFTDSTETVRERKDFNQDFVESQLFYTLCLAVWKVAESQRREAALLDGSHRVGREDGK